MALTELKKNFAPKAAAVGLGALLVLSPLAAQADQARTVPATYSQVTLNQAEEQVEAYVAETGNIGILLGYRAVEGIPPADAIGSKLVELFQDRGVEAAYFVFDPGAPGAGVAYFIPNIADKYDPLVMGSWPVPEAARKIDQVVQIHQGGKNLAAQFDLE